MNLTPRSSPLIHQPVALPRAAQDFERVEQAGQTFIPQTFAF